MVSANSKASSIAISTVGDLARSMMRRRPKEGNGLTPTVFFIGAGCSRSAGVPTTPEIAKELIKELYSAYYTPKKMGPEKCLKVMVDDDKFTMNLPDDLSNIDWGAVYDEIFRSHYKSPDEIRPIFQRFVSRAKNINWAHLALGELAHKKWISTTVTTNFDLLALEGYARAGVIPVVSDGIESLNRIDGTPSYQQLVQINGSIHAYRLRNNPKELQELSENEDAKVFFRNIFGAGHPIVFIGYSGREKEFMDLLISAFKTTHGKQVYWCMNGNDSNALSEHAKNFLSHSENSALILGQDADAFFYELSQKLRVGQPLSIKDPLGFQLKQLESVIKPKVSPSSDSDDDAIIARKRAQTDIKDAIEKAVSIIAATSKDIAEKDKTADKIEVEDENMLSISIFDHLRQARFDGDEDQFKNLTEKLEEETFKEEKNLRYTARSQAAHRSVIGALLQSRGGKDALKEIQHLDTVKKLNIPGYNLLKLDFVEHLPNLEQLNIAGSNIYDLTPLKKLKKLSSLYLGGTLVDDLTPIATLPNLKRLNISGLKGVAEFSIFKKLKKLTHIDASGTNITSLAGIPESIESINVAGTNLSSLYHLRNCGNLKTLVLANTKVIDLSALEACQKLENINLWNTSVVNLIPLNNLKNLKKIYVKGTDVNTKTLEDNSILIF